MKDIMNIKLNHISENPMIKAVILMVCPDKSSKFNSRENKMNTVNTAVLGQIPAAPAAPVSSSKTLATVMLAAGVSAMVVIADQLIDSWAESHIVAAWLALWLVAIVAIVLLRGVTRSLAQNLITGLDAWSAHVARRRADDRLWVMAQSDPRLMGELQQAMDRATEEAQPVRDLETLMNRRASRIVRDRMYYI
jgi:hypothetical protein